MVLVLNNLKDTLDYQTYVNYSMSVAVNENWRAAPELIVKGKGTVKQKLREQMFLQDLFIFLIEDMRTKSCQLLSLVQ